MEIFTGLVKTLVAEHEEAILTYLHGCCGIFGHKAIRAITNNNLSLSTTWVHVLHYTCLINFVPRIKERNPHSPCRQHHPGSDLRGLFDGDGTYTPTVRARLWPETNILPGQERPGSPPTLRHPQPASTSTENHNHRYLKSQRIAALSAATIGFINPQSNKRRADQSQRWRESLPSYGMRAVDSIEITDHTDMIRRVTRQPRGPFMANAW
jgi:hypothetical protein